MGAIAQMGEPQYRTNRHSSPSLRPWSVASSSVLGRYQGLFYPSADHWPLRLDQGLTLCHSSVWRWGVHGRIYDRRQIRGLEFVVRPIRWVLAQYVCRATSFDLLCHPFRIWGGNPCFWACVKKKTNERKRKKEENEGRRTKEKGGLGEGKG